MRTLKAELMRPKEIVAEKKRCPVIYFPLSPLEWHGPHLPVGTDALRSREVAFRVARKIGGVVLPTFFWGTDRALSPEFLRNVGFKGSEYIIGVDYPKNTIRSFYCKEEIFALLVREMLNVLIINNYKVIVIVNGHGAPNQIAVLKRISDEFNVRKSAKVILTFAGIAEGTGLLCGEVESCPGIGHAAREETSEIMALYPESVDLHELPGTDEALRNIDWAVLDNQTCRGHPTADFTVRKEKDPRARSSAKLGEKRIEAAAAQIADKVKRILAELRE